MMPNHKPTPRSGLDSSIKIRQLQQYRHCSGCILTVPHPFVKQMARSQVTPPWSGPPFRNLIAVMLLGFRVMSLRGLPSLLKPLALLFRRSVGRSNRDHQMAPLPEISMSVKENSSLLPPKIIILDGSLDNN